MPNLFPNDINLEEINMDTEEPLNFKGSYLFDFEKGKFVKDVDGSIFKCDDLQAYIQWCNKAMATARYKALAYTSRYGQEFEELIRSGLSKDAIELEIKRITEETLLVHPRTREIANFIFSLSNDKEEIHYEYEIVTIYDERFKLDNTVKVW